ncbi:MAG: hypothetical protein HND47_18640 [Chloroflexi bacterium]|nr:hypothetical protein [Chloroflexota bacterium]
MPRLRHTSLTRRMMRPGRGRDGDDDLVHLFGVERFFELVNFADDRDAIDLVILLGGVVIQKADGNEIELRSLLQLADDERARVARAEDEGVAGLAVGLHRRLLGKDPQNKARSADEDERDEPVNAESGARHARLDEVEADQHEHHA